jgi:hypothetical protein
MAYSVSNPPALISEGMGEGPRLWSYKSTDAETAFDDTDYITNASKLGMKTGDAVLVLDTTNSLTTLAQVTVVADGNGTLTPLTAIT